MNRKTGPYPISSWKRKASGYRNPQPGARKIQLKRKMPQKLWKPPEPGKIRKPGKVREQKM
jgi:hypothetical protein